jgi:hypothetical protein
MGGVWRSNELGHAPARNVVCARNFAEEETRRSGAARYMT